MFTSGYDPFDYNLLIYNRWGEIVFESHNVEIGWDGTYGVDGQKTEVQDGTYTWTIDFKTENRIIDFFIIRKRLKDRLGLVLLRISSYLKFR